MKANEKTSLLHQLSVVKRRTRDTVRALTEAMNGLPAADELPHPSEFDAESDDHGDQCDLHRYCICLEVALDEATRWARKLQEGARAVANGAAAKDESHERPPVPREGDATAGILLAESYAGSDTLIGQLSRVSGSYEGVLAEGVRAARDEANQGIVPGKLIATTKPASDMFWPADA